MNVALPHRMPELVPAVALHLLWQRYFLVDPHPPAMFDDRVLRGVTGGVLRIGVGTRIRYDSEIATVVEPIVT